MKQTLSDNVNTSSSLIIVQSHKIHFGVKLCLFLYNYPEIHDSQPSHSSKNIQFTSYQLAFIT